MSDEPPPIEQHPPPIEKHAATDRFGKEALRTAHRLTVAMAGSDPAAEEPIVVRTDGPHRTLDGLAALIDEALADTGPPGTEPAGAEEETDRPAPPDQQPRR